MSEYQHYERGYDLSVSRLQDLRDLAMRQGALAMFLARLNTLLDAHRRKKLFIQRVEAVKLTDPAP